MYRPSPIVRTPPSPSSHTDTDRMRRSSEKANRTGNEDEGDGNGEDPDGPAAFSPFFRTRRATKGRTRFFDRKGGRDTTRRARAFGVEMKDDRIAKITDVGRFLNWGWWAYLTPSFRSTVFARPGLHLTVLFYILIGNASHWIVHLKYAEMISEHPEMVLPFASRIVQNQMTWDRSLMTFVLSTYALRLLLIYWTGTRSKSGMVISTMSKIVDTISVYADYDTPRAEPFLVTLHHTITLIGYYSFAIAVKGTKYRLTKRDMRRLFEEREMDADYLLLIHCKQAVSVLRLAMLEAVSQELNQKDGCLKRMDPICWDSLRTELALYCGGAMSLMSSTSSSKLPFGYFSLINWGCKIMAFFYTVFTFAWSAQESITDGYPMPFSCWAPVFHSDGTPHFCPTQFYILANVGFMCSLYFIFGLLELYYCINMIWESGLLLENYLSLIDTVCEPLLEKPKTFSELRSKPTSPVPPNSVRSLGSTIKVA